MIKKNQIKTILSSVVKIILIVLYCTIPQPTFAQEESIELHLNRDWGYGGFGEIQGLFTLKASGPDNLVSVTFLIDGQVMAEVTQSPFVFRFNTDQYALGKHSISATGMTLEGQELNSNEITTTFVTPDAGWKSALRMIVPVLVIIVVAFAVSIIVTFSTGKKRLNPPPGTERRYGSAGGSICPKCQRPTPLHWFGLNLGLWKYDRCENCLRWSGMKSLPLNNLRQAEKKELTQALEIEQASPGQFSTEEEKLKREIEDSRFQELK